MEVKTKVNSITGTQPIRTKDGKDLTKTSFTAADGKSYVTFSRVAIGDEIEGTASIDTFSGELRFKKTPKPFNGGRGGGESNKQTALKAAAMVSGSATQAINTAEELFLPWLEQAGPPAQTQQPLPPAPDLPPTSVYGDL